MRPDGSGYIRLTGGATIDSAPILSPDGGRVMFERTDPAAPVSADIWTINSDGTGEMPITLTDEYEDWPSWSPDGTRAVFTRSSESDGRPVSEIVVRDISPDAGSLPASADTVVLRREAEPGTFVDFKPTWSPDGSRIAFVSNMDGAYRLYTIRIDGADLVLVADVRAEGRPAWSPDSSMVAFQDIHDGGCIWAVDASGDEPRLVAKDECTGGPVSWSPDGTMIAWAGGGGLTGIHVINADGTEPRQLAPERAYGDLDWGVTAP
jgi:Tol biopolymer transport system component